MSHLTEQQRRNAEFFVKLLYIDLDSPDEDWEAFCVGWRHLEGVSYWPDDENVALQEPHSEEWVRSAAQWIRQHLKERRQHPEQRVWVSTLEYVNPHDLRALQRITRNLIFGLLIEGEAESKVLYVLRLKDGKVHKRLKYEDAHGDVLLLILLPLLEHSPFPFGKCAFCYRVFVHKGGRGKPRKYCSPACKVKGVPTAKRTEYKRRQRQKQRDKELQRVQLLNKVRLKQRRTKSMQEKED